MLGVRKGIITACHAYLDYWVFHNFTVEVIHLITEEQVELDNNSKVEKQGVCNHADVILIDLKLFNVLTPYMRKGIRATSVENFLALILLLILLEGHWGIKGKSVTLIATKVMLWTNNKKNFYFPS